MSIFPFFSGTNSFCHNPVQDRRWSWVNPSNKADFNNNLVYFLDKVNHDGSTKHMVVLDSYRQKYYPFFAVKLC